FSPDGTRIATRRGKDMILFDARTGKEVFTLKGSTLIGAELVFSPDGGRLALFEYMVLGGDGVVRLHDARTGLGLVALKAPAPLGPLSFSRDGTQIAVGDREGLRVWRAPQDLAAWQAERTQALADGVLGWHRTQAAEFERAGLWFAAAFHLSQLIQAEPQDGMHHLRRGWALARQGKTDAAKQDFDQALRCKVSLSELDQATAYAELGRWEEAA